MNVFVITTNMEESQVHNVSVVKGKYLRPKRVTGNFSERADSILSYILQERPNKVIVEDVAFGKGVMDSLASTMSKHGFSLEEDGTVNY